MQKDNQVIIQFCIDKIEELNKKKIELSSISSTTIIYDSEIFYYNNLLNSML